MLRPGCLVQSIQSVPILFNPGSHSQHLQSIYYFPHVLLTFVDGVHLPDGLGAGLQSVRRFLSWRPQHELASRSNTFLLTQRWWIFANFHLDWQKFNHSWITWRGTSVSLFDLSMCCQSSIDPNYVRICAVVWQVKLETLKQFNMFKTRNCIMKVAQSSLRFACLQLSASFSATCLQNLVLFLWEVHLEIAACMPKTRCDQIQVLQWR